MSYSNLLVEKEGKIALVTIHREKQLNALNKQTLEELEEVFIDLEKDVEVRGIILTGSGSKAFVAGADIKEFLNFPEDQGAKLAAAGHKVMDRIYDFSKPVIAAINGFALGGGLEIAMSCHIRVAVQEAKVGLPEVSLGLIPGYGGTQRLEKLVGRGKALEMILTGDMVTAEDAYHWGLVNYVVESDDLLTKAKEILNKTFSKSPQAIAKAIEAVNASTDSDKKGYQVEIDLFGKIFGTDEFKEGVDAFINKRKPNF